MFLRAHRVLTLAARTPTTRIASFFAKEAPKKDGKKDDKAAPAAAVIEETPIEELALKWINPNHSGLSPSELKLYQEGFEDLSASDKELLDDFAERMLTQPTAIFYDAVLKKGSFGTSQLFYTAVDPLPEAELLTQIKGVRKEL